MIDDDPFYCAIRHMTFGFLTATVWYFLAKGFIWWKSFLDWWGE